MADVTATLLAIEGVIPEEVAVAANAEPATALSPDYQQAGTEARPSPDIAAGPETGLVYDENSGGYTILAGDEWTAQGSSGEGSNSVDVPGASPSVSEYWSGLWGGVSSTVSGAVQAGTEAIKAIPSAAEKTLSYTGDVITGMLTKTGQAIGTVTGATASAALWPLVPIIVVLVVVLAVGLRFSGTKLRVGA